MSGIDSTLSESTALNFHYWLSQHLQPQQASSGEN